MKNFICKSAMLKREKTRGKSNATLSGREGMFELEPLFHEEYLCTLSRTQLGYVKSLFMLLYFSCKLLKIIIKKE